MYENLMVVVALDCRLETYLNVNTEHGREVRTLTAQQSFAQTSVPYETTGTLIGGLDTKFGAEIITISIQLLQVYDLQNTPRGTASPKLSPCPEYD